MIWRARESLYDKAIKLDPNFALAWARLSQLESWMYYAIEPTPARMEKARTAAAEALRLQPNLAEAHLANGLVSYYLDRDYARALSELAIAQDDLPNDAVVARIIAAIQRREGRWRESTISYQKAASLDPKDPILLENMGWNFLVTRNYPEAAKIFDRAVKVAPDTFTIRELRARVISIREAISVPPGRCSITHRKLRIRTERSCSRVITTKCFAGIFADCCASSNVAPR